MNWGRFRNPFVCCWAVAKIHVQKGFFPWAEKLVVPFRWKFSLWRSGWQQQNSPRKLLCWQPSHIFQGRRILQACQKWTALTTWLLGGLHFEPFYTQMNIFDTDALELLELISIYFSVFDFADHGSYTGFCVHFCSKPVRKLINALAGPDALDDPSLFESWHFSVPSPSCLG